MNKLVYRRSNCRACNGFDLELVLSLTPTPIGDAYVTAEQLSIPQPSYPIDLHICQACGLAQLIDIIDPSVLYGEYIYLTASSSGLNEHFEKYARQVLSRCRLPPSAFVIDIGSNDGTLLHHFQEKGMNILGIEPAKHIAAQANSKGIRTIAGFFSIELAQQIVKKYGKANLITANNVFANIDDLITWVKSVDELLALDGIFVFESYYLADLINNMVFDFIYHEHLSAISIKPMQILFSSFGLELVAVERIATKGGSLRYFIQRTGGPMVKDGSVETMLALEMDMGLYKKQTYTIFNNKIESLKDKVRNFILPLRAQGKVFVGFGASITGTTLIYHFGMEGDLEYLVDDNLAKQNRFSPGIHLPVLSSLVLLKQKPEYVIILAWRFAKDIINKNMKYLENGGTFIIPVPEFKIVNMNNVHLVI